MRLELWAENFLIINIENYEKVKKFKDLARRN